MKKFYLSFLLLLAFMHVLNAKVAVKDSLTQNLAEYREEIGFFQKANRDLGDPRFMFYDEKERISFGIGGTAKVNAFFGFHGLIAGKSFKPGLIEVPFDGTPSFGMKIGSSELHAKARYSWGKGKSIIGYVKFDGDDNDMVKISQAYISLGGLSIGKIPSFFMDLELGVMTSGIGIDGQVDATHTLVGYRHKFGEHWYASWAFEQAGINLDHFSAKSCVRTNLQVMPDFTSNLKYRWKNGHVQLALVVRNMSYWAVPEVVEHSSDGLNRYCLGIGGSFSGNLRPSPKLKLSWQVAGGRGIASYMNDFQGSKLDLALGPKDSEGLGTMASIPVLGAMAAMQYNWTDAISSSLVLAHTNCFKVNGYENFVNLRSTDSAIVNLFWYFNQYSYLGLEYLFGFKRAYADGSSLNLSSPANSLSCVIAYMF